MNGTAHWFEKIILALILALSTWTVKGVHELRIDVATAMERQANNKELISDLRSRVTVLEHGR